ncbi:hypothetical protein [uncultured Shewanella sp.]|uniref:hypothetical protein n=1 Tax=uncultured Shewanella sp. TaxID=173975 RepID=UPI00261B9578|nr:hypothetical protein [uncultured Shewanella sp.]
MYSIRRNLLLGLAVLFCYTLVCIYSARLENVSMATQAHQYGTDLAYNASELVESRVSPATIYNRARIDHLHPAGGDKARNSTYRGSEFSSVNSRVGSAVGGQKSQINSVEFERGRVSSILNAAIFLLGVTIASLAFTGENMGAEFNDKVVFLSLLVLIDALFIAGPYTMALPVAGVILLYGRRYLGGYFTPHQE